MGFLNDEPSLIMTSPRNMTHPFRVVLFPLIVPVPILEEEVGFTKFRRPFTGDSAAFEAIGRDIKGSTKQDDEKAKGNRN
jgi:hypothetical protein